MAVSHRRGSRAMISCSRPDTTRTPTRYPMPRTRLEVGCWWSNGLQLQAHDRAHDEQPSANGLHDVEDELVRLHRLTRANANGVQQDVDVRRAAPDEERDRRATDRQHERALAVGILMRGATTIAMTKYASATVPARTAIATVAMAPTARSRRRGAPRPRPRRRRRPCQEQQARTHAIRTAPSFNEPPSCTARHRGQHRRRAPSPRENGGITCRPSGSRRAVEAGAEAWAGTMIGGYFMVSRWRGSLRCSAMLRRLISRRPSTRRRWPRQGSRIRLATA